MKKIIIILSIIYFIHNPSFGQNTNSKSFWTNSRVEVLGCYGLMQGGTGFALKGKKEIFSSKHLEGFAGLALQCSYWSETDKFLTGVDGYNRDIGTHIVFEFVCYPFKKKGPFIGSEPFIGLTNLKSKGFLTLPEYEMDHSYANSYSYINYGFTETIGYNFGRVSTSFFAMMSLKGILDSGRTRPGDFDSKIFVGVSLGFKLIQ